MESNKFYEQPGIAIPGNRFEEFRHDVEFRKNMVLVSPLPMSPSPILVRLLPALLLAALPREGHAIINGSEAGEDEFPATAALVKRINTATPAVFGSGVLIGDQWILTAAHSLGTETVNSFEVWLGVTDLADLSSLRVYRVLAIHRHPGFTTGSGTSENDIALLLLDRPVTGIAPLAVSDDPADSPAGTAGTVAGWGTTVPGESSPSLVLRKAPASIVSNTFANGFYGGILTDNHIAARDPALTAMPCFGDSGGPLVIDSGGADTLAGIVSFGPADCDDASVPTIYTHVARYEEWISGFLALTVTPSAIRVTGKGQVIRDGDGSPRRSDGTDFGRVRPGKGSTTRSFRVENSGGLLTVRSSKASGGRFSIRRDPSAVIASGGSSSLKVRFRATRKERKWKSRIRLFTNDPGAPIYSFRVESDTR